MSSAPFTVDSPEVRQAMTTGCPVRAASGEWLLAGYGNVRSVLRDTTSFGSFHPDNDIDERPMLQLEGRLHLTLRRTLGQFFTAEAVESYRPVVTDQFARALDESSELSPADFLATVARPATGRTIGILARVPEPLIPAIQNFADDFTHFHLGDETRRAPVERFHDSMFELLHSMRADGVDDDGWLSVLLHATDHEGNPLSERRIVTMFATDLLVGGAETSTRVLVLTLYRLLQRRDLYERLVVDPSLIPAAVEEGLRTSPGLRYLYRTVRDDVDYSEMALGGGALLLPHVEAANLDAAFVEQPLEFRLDRGDVGSRHLSFGSGRHVCVGAPLARLELTTALELLVARFPDLRLAPGYTPEPGHFGPMNGLARLPLVWR
jgi:cytochrome P450 monooxygenase OleP